MAPTDSSKTPPDETPRAAPRGSLEQVEVEGGFLIRGSRCRVCGVKLTLEAEEAVDLGDEPDPHRDDKPRRLPFLRWAGAAARGVVVCDECSALLSQKEAEVDTSVTRDQRSRSSGLPAALRGLPFEAMDRSGGRRGAIVAAQAWAMDDEHHERQAPEFRRLFLFGPYGTGKTRLAATAAWKALDHRGVTWMPVSFLLQAGFADPRSMERKRALEGMIGFGALVLDDLGKEKPGEWARQIMFGAIDSRVQEGSPIIITSNFDADELTDRLGGGIGSRLREFRQYELGGRDRRQPPPRRDLA